jgi:hypothetical protein
MRQAALLRQSRIEDVDIVGVAEQLEGLGRDQVYALRSTYSNLCRGLLELMHNPSTIGATTELVIVEMRETIAWLLQESPCLNRVRESLFREGYEDARRRAAAEANAVISNAKLPTVAPFSVDEAESQSFRPTSAKLRTFN